MKTKAKRFYTVGDLLTLSWGDWEDFEQSHVYTALENFDIKKEMDSAIQFNLDKHMNRGCSLEVAKECLSSRRIAAKVLSKLEALGYIEKLNVVDTYLGAYPFPFETLDFGDN